jgi:hypothetical protein
MTDRPYLTQTTQGLMVAMPPDAAGDREMLTINQAHARLLELLSENDGYCPGESCDACDLADLLSGIR